MGKAKKTSKNQKAFKQLTLDSLPNVTKKISVEAAKSVQEKQIIITEIDSVIKEDELILKIGFRVVPSTNVFSKIKTDLFFDKQKLKSVSLSIPQGPLAANDFELTPVLDMKDTNAGSHTIKVEMYEEWSSGEKLSFVSKQVTIKYVPVARESRLIRIPIVKRFEQMDLEVISQSDQNIYHEIEQTIKKELASKRDDW